MIKWLSNFWYHYKFRTILCLFLAVVVGVSIFEIATREKYDLKVYLYLSQGISDDVERSLEETIEQIYKENGEEKNVQVINFSYDPYSNNGDSKMSYASALTGEIQMKKNFLFITDSYRFEELNENDSFINLFNKEDFFNKYDNKAFSIKETNFETKFIKNLKENDQLGWTFTDEKKAIEGVKMPELFVSLITPPDKSSKNYQSFLNAEKLAKLIVEN